MSQDRRNQQIVPPDGQRLGFSEYGSATGKVVLYFHGWPGSRVEPEAIDNAKHQVGVRIVAVDRPGYGLSDFQEGRRILDWPQDITRLVEALDFGRFAVMGVSGGGPYAAVCAAKLPDRVTGATLVCGVGPLDERGAAKGMNVHNRWMLRFGQIFPWLARKVIGLSLRWAWDYEHEVLPKALLKSLPIVDQEAVSRPEMKKMLLTNWREAFRRGSRGMLWDGNLYARPWGFRLEEVQVPIQLWQGELDTIVPPQMGHYCASVIPNCRAHFFPEEGHFPLPFRHMREILAGLSI